MRLLVIGTDTDVGKTVFSAALAGATGAFYWKPFQAGLTPASDSETIAELSGLRRTRIIAEAYRLKTAASIHRAAELEAIEIECAQIEPPAQNRLIVEGAGGALVPLTRGLLLADLFARWNLPAVVVARTSLGTINHSLLTIEALRNRGVRVLGIAFVGDAQDDSERTIAEIAGVKRLGRLPILHPLNRRTLADAFSSAFKIEDFR
ncbi:MAG TPA: dethiobiotin synthase [Sphingomicrobium sp.]|nr:dethiobiotin synthase [Sphingomicrobium sp.]